METHLLTQTKKKKRRKTVTCPEECPNLQIVVCCGFQTTAYYNCRDPKHWTTCAINRLPECPLSCRRDEDYKRRYCYELEELEKERKQVAEFLEKLLDQQADFMGIAKTLEMPLEKIRIFCRDRAVKRRTGRPNNEVGFSVRFQILELMALFGLSRQRVKDVIEGWNG